MKTISRGLIISICVGALAPFVAAKPSVNDMQMCQASIEFITQKAEALSDKSAAKTITTGLSAYDGWIQSEVIDPGLLEYTGGDKAKAKAFQDQIDQFKAKLVGQMGQRYSQPGMITDYAVMIDNCVKKGNPGSTIYDQLKASVDAIIAQAQAK